MTLIAVSDATSEHTGTTVVGPVAGTVLVGSNSFVIIGGLLIMVDDGTLEVPNHQYNLIPPLFHSHSFVPDVLAQGFVTIEGKKIVLVGDSYSADATIVKTAGSNTFVNI